MPPARNVGPKASHLLLGERGEAAAEKLLRAKGYRVLYRNWRAGSLELDLVCRTGRTVVFVEVKARGAGSRGSPTDGLTPAKRSRLARAAAQWLSAHDLWGAPCRFDLVAVHAAKGEGGEPGTLECEHFENVIDIAEALSAQGSWQPW
ncbi:UPF0102 protein yraN [Desulfovibrio sp. X2]|uniref:YraN family protein n=1 Tax=Desulfovibrio sp. X2 TaxID=941449 RepID=UPI000358C624|nr:YraN family protein [Desulfovibrio sp. X2]EPR41678.1 UPF0102 protein yraN [Desulfovibrio sp. X2]